MCIKLVKSSASSTTIHVALGLAFMALQCTSTEGLQATCAAALELPMNKDWTNFELKPKDK